MGGGGQAAHLLLVGIAVEKPHARHAGGAGCPSPRPGSARPAAPGAASGAAAAPARRASAARAGRRRARPRSGSACETPPPARGQHVGADAGIARRVHLEPALIALRAASGPRACASPRWTGHRECPPPRRGAPAAFRLGPDQPGHPHRRDAEGHGVVAAEEPSWQRPALISPRSAAGRNRTRSSAARLRAGRSRCRSRCRRTPRRNAECAASRGP
jgi:hypothetical protein